jgi:hypothetical protein
MNRLRMEYAHGGIRDMDESDDVPSKLPEWHRVLREIYAGVQDEQNKPRPSRVIRDQAKW